jgi:hypothetical protein
MTNDPGQSTPSVNIPARWFLAASKDAKLKLLLRQIDTAERRVAKALEGVVDAKGAVADYVAATYPEPGVDRLKNALDPVSAS